MKKNAGKQAVINFIGQHPGCSFQDIRRGTGLDSSVVNSSLWQMNIPAHHQRRLQHHINRMWLEKMPVPSIIGAARLLGRTTYTSKKVCKKPCSKSESV
ncbi:hypothetical protein [Raoultella ornithinolytica]|uniref:hypothetical protein n=1 Tax=Raoultella ornithinolytica TaxID=54291 RepID=UPI0002CCE806|nr:hypothetical protein [Raoultella ornithinolytica]AGJ86734.1 hypothetical protein RORB6_10240 [Raoultella ornithinolytica B6]